MLFIIFLIIATLFPATMFYYCFVPFTPIVVERGGKYFIAAKRLGMTHWYSGGGDPGFGSFNPRLSVPFDTAGEAWAAIKK